MGGYYHIRDIQDCIGLIFCTSSYCNCKWARCSHVRNTSACTQCKCNSRWTLAELHDAFIINCTYACIANGSFFKHAEISVVSIRAQQLIDSTSISVEQSSSGHSYRTLCEYVHIRKHAVTIIGTYMASIEIQWGKRRRLNDLERFWVL